LPDQSATTLAAAASVASYSQGNVGIAGFTTAQTFSVTDNGTNAALFTANADNTTSAYSWVLGYEGTATFSDVGPDVSNAFGTSSRYTAAVDIAGQVEQDYGDDGLLTGHSLGGGEAALASYVTGITAITFNAAGVQPSAYGYVGSASQITNYTVAGEPLTTAQSVLPIPGALGNQVVMSPVTFPWFSNGFNHSMNAVIRALCNYLGNCGP
jgi:hypothetical protein